jgi:hypothetical protein
MLNNRFWANSVFAISLVAMAPGIFAQSWESRLQDGSRIRVDPGSNRATVTNRKGAETQLWDGIHRLHDGNTIEIRQGVMVPNESLLQHRRGISARRPSVVQGVSACIVLERKLCGLHGECTTHEACTHARQLLQFETQEKLEKKAGTSFSYEQIPTQCQAALDDENLFKPCPVQRLTKKPSLCEQLVERVCGAKDQCNDRPGCAPAKQLFKMENEERITSFNPETATYTTGQCRMALRDVELFAPCTRSITAGGKQ